MKRGSGLRLLIGSATLLAFSPGIAVGFALTHTVDLK
jgi:hypothetical protein